MFFERIIRYLERKRWLNLLLVAAYTYVVLFYHDFFVQCSIVVMNSLSLPAYNTAVMYTSVIGFAFFSLASLMLLVKTPHSWKTKLGFLLLSLLLLALHALLMFEMNIEIIHTVEFTILIFLLFPFTRRLGASMALSLPIMLLDELNQYLVLYPTYNKYLELSDLVLNIIGAGTFMVMLSMAGVRFKPIYIKSKWLTLPEVVIPVVMLLIGLTGLYTGYFAAHESLTQAHTIFVFNRLPDYEAFWHTHAFTGARYHIMWPVEGMLSIAAVTALYTLFDFLLRPVTYQAN